MLEQPTKVGKPKNEAEEGFQEGLYPPWIFFPIWNHNCTYSYRFQSANVVISIDISNYFDAKPSKLGLDCHLNDPDLIKITKSQTEYTARFAAYEFLYVFCSNYSAISNRNPVFSRWPWSDLSRSPKVKLITPSDSPHIFSYPSSIVTIALSRTQTLFLADDLDLTFQGHQRSNWLHHPIRKIWFPMRLP